jgi:protein phosphatase
MNIEIPELCLVILIGSSSAGKSTFARKHFKSTAIISSDACRAMVADDENVMDANQATFELVHFIIEKRLERGLLTVVDATNLQTEGRKALVRLARKYHVFPIGIALNMPESILYERNKKGRQLPQRVIRSHHRQMKRSFRMLKKEGIRKWFELKTEEEVANATISLRAAWNNKKAEHGPFDIIGDVHGCFKELRQLLEKMGYHITKHRDRNRNFGYTVRPPAGRKALFVGDLVDRGPASNEVLRLVMSMHQAGHALCVVGNHDAKLLKKLEGKNVQIKHGLAETLEQLETEPPEFMEALQSFLKGLISHYVLDNGKLVVAHAGLREEMQGRTSKAVRSFCMYGETTGEIDEFGLPVRYNWAQDYKGKAMVIYGHTPVHEATWFNNTIDIDTGCVFGGKLTALRYPERELCSVPAAKEYMPPGRPITPAKRLPGDEPMLKLQDFIGRHTINTGLRPNITIPQERNAAAIEIMSRFGVHPNWLIYLPPTMSPSETSNQEDYLEHPKEAFEYFRSKGINEVICEEKHMGSRAVVVIGKDKEAIEKRFGIIGEELGCIYTRTGRTFFEDKHLESALLARLQQAITEANLWESLSTDWMLLDGELMPWSAKAQQLLQQQYAAVGASGKLALSTVNTALTNAKERGLEVETLIDTFAAKEQQVAQFSDAYRHYCWEVKGIEDYRLAPFHLLATEGEVHHQKGHDWHLAQIHKIGEQDALFQPTNYRMVRLDDPSSEAAATQWWLDMTQKGGEGMVVKPLSFIASTAKGLVQPAVKCRGREYLRIIYGPEYTQEAKLQALRKRGLSHKRSMAIREFALGIEGLERFVKYAPFSKVHQCALGVLALESEPVDPRL